MFTLLERRCKIKALWLNMGLAEPADLPREVWDGELRTKWEKHLANDKKKVVILLLW